ncbi:MAG: hypothetical protein D6698_15045 [Gammaproteobacteria bacterium]|nr:MAG: hypothetical protein D6698_15045 [Gammaproteobacteria bacterium]
MRESLLLGRAKGIDGLIELEYAKGEIGGIKVFLSIPDTIIEDLSDQLEEAKEALREDEENRE